MVVLGIVGGPGAVVGTNVDEVGGLIVVVVSSGSVVAVVVATGGEDVAGALVPAFRGAVVATVAWVPPEGMVATDVVLGLTVDVVVEVAFDVVVAPAVVEVGRTVVVGDWVATCCLGDVSAPVATSTSMAARAMAART